MRTNVTAYQNTHCSWYKYTYDGLGARSSVSSPWPKRHAICLPKKMLFVSMRGRNLAVVSTKTHVSVQ